MALEKEKVQKLCLISCVAVSVGVPYTWQIWIFRAALVLVPPLVFTATRRICSELGERAWTEVEPSVARD